MNKHLTLFLLVAVLILFSGCSSFSSSGGHLRITESDGVPDGAVIVDSNNETIMGSDVLREGLNKAEGGNSITIELRPAEAEQAEQTLEKLPYYNGSKEAGWYVYHRGTVYRITFGRNA